jgi:hypothetical protein
VPYWKCNEVFQWLYFTPDGWTLVKVKGWNCFLVDTASGQRMTVWPVWDWNRVKALFRRAYARSR